jgi:uncharacterized membrane protein (DUF373 family)|tara:strand:+ start:180 stop:416 length:237 start_codon:yes stop_codon:yes gene_type:complete
LLAAAVVVPTLEVVVVLEHFTLILVSQYQHLLDHILLILVLVEVVEDLLVIPPSHKVRLVQTPQRLDTPQRVVVEVVV